MRVLDVQRDLDVCYQADATVNAHVYMSVNPRLQALDESSVHVTFTLRKEVCFGQQVVLVGSAEGMGGWQLESGLALTWSEGHCWSATVPLPLGADVEFKFVITDPRHAPLWESGVNRSLMVSAGAASLAGAWERPMEGAAAQSQSLATPAASVQPSAAQLLSMPTSSTSAVATEAAAVAAIISQAKEAAKAKAAASNAPAARAPAAAVSSAAAAAPAPKAPVVAKQGAAVPTQQVQPLPASSAATAKPAAAKPAAQPPRLVVTKAAATAPKAATPAAPAAAVKEERQEAIVSKREQLKEQPKEQQPKEQVLPKEQKPVYMSAAAEAKVEDIIARAEAAAAKVAGAAAELGVTSPQPVASGAIVKGKAARGTRRQRKRAATAPKKQ
ncbi:hypothetical protein D9Q98_005286 [Chlorella vulgaris]|uniref:CBM20 domain-containing protein n=1 Tax=Chlorella vulgaris TaxID=3077 RepID=A0A9D4TP07_CHLVU|nr:hypothetical protein D9Q98_005286 [Chlorella vulgaris]